MPTRDPFRLKTAYNRLLSLGLVKKRKAGHFIILSMHRLIHDWITVRQDESKKEQLWETTSCIFALSRYHSNTWQPYRAYLLPPHVDLYVSTFKKPGKLTPPVQMRQAYYQFNTLVGDYIIDTTFPHSIQNMFQTLNANRPRLKRCRLPLYILNLSNLHALSKPRKDLNLELLNNVIIIQVSRLAKNDPRQLQSQYKAARNSYSKNNTAEATQHLKQVVAIEKTKNEPSEIVSHIILAKAYIVNGQAKGAIELLQDVIASPKSALKDGDPDQQVLQRVLAQAYISNGQFREGETAFSEHILSFQRKRGTALKTKVLLLEESIANGSTTQAIVDMSEQLATSEIFDANALCMAEPMRIAAMSSHAEGDTINANQDYSVC
jgi:hypothetical protein